MAPYILLAMCRSAGGVPQWYLQHALGHIPEGDGAEILRSQDSYPTAAGLNEAHLAQSGQLFVDGLAARPGHLREFALVGLDVRGRHRSGMHDAGNLAEPLRNPGQEGEKRHVGQ